MLRFEFEGEGDNDLSFKEGDVISLKERDGEWLKGELRGKSGLFPLSFVEIIEDLPVKTLPCNGAELPDTSKEQNQPLTPTTKNEVRYLFLLGHSCYDRMLNKYLILVYLKSINLEPL